MKTSYKGGLFVVFILFFTLSLEARERLVISRPDFPTSVATLMGERVLQEAYTRMGIDLELKKLPLLRSPVMANNGDTDGEFLRIVGFDKKYPNLVMVSVPIAYEDIMAYTKEVEFAVEGWRSLSPYTIGIAKSFRLAEINTQGMNVERVSTIDQAFHKLDSGRNDVVVDFRSRQCWVRNSNLKGIRVLEPPITQIVLYHYLHKRHKTLAEKLATVLRGMEQEGELKTIQQKAVQDFMDSCQQQGGR